MKTLMLAPALALLTGAAAVAQDAHPDLSGRWQLNKKESEDANSKFLWLGGPGPGRSPSPSPSPGTEERRRRPEGVGPGGPGGPGAVAQARIDGEMPAAFRDFTDPAPTLTITASEAGLVVDDGRGVKMTLRPDGREEREGNITRVVKWEGPSLVVDSRVDRGARLLSRYNLMPGTRRVEVYSMLTDAQHHTVTLRRVYDAAEAGP